MTRQIGIALFRRRELIVIGLTTLVMAAVVAGLVVQLRPLLPADWSNCQRWWSGIEGDLFAEATRDDAEESQARSETPSPRRSVTPPRHEVEPSVSAGKAILLVGGVFAGAVVSPFVFACCLFGLLRRHTARFGPLIQIQAAGLVAAPAPAAPKAAASVEAAPPPQPAPRKSEALFERLFEETLELQTQLDESKRLS